MIVAFRPDYTLFGDLAQHYAFSYLSLSSSLQCQPLHISRTVYSLLHNVIYLKFILLYILHTCTECSLLCWTAENSRLDLNLECSRLDCGARTGAVHSTQTPSPTETCICDRKLPVRRPALCRIATDVLLYP